MTTTLPVENCPLKFVCDLQWDWLKHTKNDTIRECRRCERDVHLCVSDAEIESAREAGHCIAIPIVDHPINPAAPKQTRGFPMVMGEPWPVRWRK